MNVMKKRRFLTTVLTVFMVSSLVFFATCTTDTTEKSKIGKQLVKIGVLTPLSGNHAQYGEDTKKGISIAEEIIKSNPGNKYDYEVVYRDTQGDQNKALSVIKQTVDFYKIRLFIGPFRSIEVLTVAKYAEDSKVILFSASATADEIKNSGDYIFRNVPTNKKQGDTAAEFVINGLQKKKAFILYKNSDYGISLRESFSKKFKELGGEIIGEDSFEDGETNYRGILSKIKFSQPEVIYFPGNYGETALILKKAHELDIQSIWVGGDGSIASDLIKIAGPAAEGTFYTNMALGFGKTDAEIKDFVSKFKGKYNHEPAVYSAYACDALLMLYQAIEQCGPEPDKVKDCLYRLEYKGTTGITKFDEFGEVEKDFYIYEIKNGNFVLYKEWISN